MKRPVLLISLLLVVLAVQAQTKLVFEETKQDAYLMKRTGNGEQAALNSIIDLLAAAKVSNGSGGRPNRTPEFTLRMEQQARIADAGDQLQLKVQLRNIHISGDVLYRGFNLGDVLLPEGLQGKVELLNGQGKVVKTFNVQQAQLKGKDVVLLEATVPDSAADQRYRLRVEKKLQYTAADVRRVQERLQLVKEYEAADAAVGKALQEAARIQPDDIDRISLQDRHLHQLEELYGRYRNADFREKLNLRQNDPQRLNARLSQLERVLQERRRAIDYALATLDEQFYNRGVSLLHSGNTTLAQVYFAKSVEVNPAFAPAHVELARLDYLNGHIAEALTRTRDLLTHMRLDPQTEQRALSLAQDIYGTYITSGNTLTSRGAYHDALAAFAAARELCSTLGGLRCNLAALNDGEARAATGAFRGMVESGRQLLLRSHLQEAEQAASEALAFQREYDVVLHNAPEATELMNQVQFQVYLRHIDEGKQQLARQQYDAALHQFDAALEAEQRYAFQPVRELRALAARAAKPVLLAQLSDGYALAMQNNLAGARQTASTAAAMQERYALQQDGEVQAKYKLLSDRIFTQECLNAQALYDRHFQNAQNLIREKKFIAADQAFQSAIQSAADNAACHIATFTATGGRASIAPAAAYQRKLEEVSRLIQSSRYTEAIQGYQEAEQYYLGQEVSRFGLSHVPLYHYASAHSKQPFTAAVVAYFANAGEEQEALRLLASLLDSGYAKGKTRKVQQQLGAQLAVKDAQRHLPEDVKALSAQYSRQNRKLRKFQKAYEKQRKQLAKS